MAENTPDFGGGGITPEMLRAGRNALKAAPIKPAKPLPGLAPGASAIPLGVRVLANSIQTAVVYNVRFRRECPRFSGLFSLPPTSFDLQKYLNAIASGKENLNHANFNTTYRNRGGELPLKSNPLKQQGIRYFEYGWSEIIPQSVWAQWYAPPSYLKLAPAEVTGRLSGFLKLDGGALNTPRLIFSESGEVFFTPDHYHVFFRYSEVLMTWTPYLSPVFRGQSSDWDASIYQPGTKETGFR